MSETEAIAQQALLRRRDLATSLADADDALDAALTEMAAECGVSETARRLGLSRKTTDRRVNRHRRRTL